MAHQIFDVIIAGLGAMGSAAAYHLSRRGARVLGLDRFGPPHAWGSSHGQTRIIREAYFEHPSYVPLVKRAYELWADLELESSQNLWRQTGGLMIGSPESAVVEGARRSATEHLLPHEVFSANEVRKKFPAFHLAEGMVAVWEPRAGVLFPEKCIATHLELAARHGATLQCEEPVIEWAADGGGVKVKTHRGDYRARCLLLAAGSWLPSLTTELQLPLIVERQVQYWFEPRSDGVEFQPEHCPIHIWEYSGGNHFYGMPNLGEGIKVACHHAGRVSDPNHLDREVKPEEVAAMRRIIRQYLPGADGSLKSTAVCMYTNTPDQHFFIDWHPRSPQVLIASPCSGHGFKFSSAIGESLAELLLTQKTRFDLSLFRHRF